jgi:metal-responsive CopG/Arc/MetJ family transcriptional regulator
VSAKNKCKDSTPNKRRLAIYLPEEAYQQIEDLAEATNIESRSAIVSQAIARWYNREPLIQALEQKREQKREREAL